MAVTGYFLEIPIRKRMNECWISNIPKVQFAEMKGEAEKLILQLIFVLHFSWGLLIKILKVSIPSLIRHGAPLLKVNTLTGYQFWRRSQTQAHAPSWKKRLILLYLIDRLVYCTVPLYINGLKTKRIFSCGWAAISWKRSIGSIWECRWFRNHRNNQITGLNELRCGQMLIDWVI